MSLLNVTSTAYDMLRSILAMLKMHRNLTLAGGKIDAERQKTYQGPEDEDK
jgi:hypothetical protein